MEVVFAPTKFRSPAHKALAAEHTFRCPDNPRQRRARWAFDAVVPAASAAPLLAGSGTFVVRTRGGELGRVPVRFALPDGAATGWVQAGGPRDSYAVQARVARAGVEWRLEQLVVYVPDIVAGALARPPPAPPSGWHPGQRVTLGAVLAI